MLIFTYTGTTQTMCVNIGLTMTGPDAYQFSVIVREVRSGEQGGQSRGKRSVGEEGGRGVEGRLGYIRKRRRTMRRSRGTSYRSYLNWMRHREMRAEGERDREVLKVTGPHGNAVMDRSVSFNVTGHFEVGVHSRFDPEGTIIEKSTAQSSLE